MNNSKSGIGLYKIDSELPLFSGLIPKNQFLSIVKRINLHLKEKKEPTYQKLRMNSGKFTDIKTIIYSATPGLAV